MTDYIFRIENNFYLTLNQMVFYVILLEIFPSNAILKKPFENRIM